MNLVRAMLLDACPGLRPDDVIAKPTSAGGVDVDLTRAAERAGLSFGVEVKNVENLNIWAALKQAAHNAGGKMPLLFFRRNRSKLYVALEAADFLVLVSQ